MSNNNPDQQQKTSSGNASSSNAATVVTKQQQQQPQPILTPEEQITFDQSKKIVDACLREDVISQVVKKPLDENATLLANQQRAEYLREVEQLRDGLEKAKLMAATTTEEKTGNIDGGASGNASGKGNVNIDNKTSAGAGASSGESLMLQAMEEAFREIQKVPVAPTAGTTNPNDPNKIDPNTEVGEFFKKLNDMAGYEAENENFKGLVETFQDPEFLEFMNVLMKTSNEISTATSGNSAPNAAAAKNKTKKKKLDLKVPKENVNDMDDDDILNSVDAAASKNKKQQKNVVGSMDFSENIAELTKEMRAKRKDSADDDDDDNSPSKKGDNNRDSSPERDGGNKDNKNDGTKKSQQQAAKKKPCPPGMEPENLMNGFAHVLESQPSFQKAMDQFFTGVMGKDLFQETLRNVVTEYEWYFEQVKNCEDHDAGLTNKVNVHFRPPSTEDKERYDKQFKIYQELCLWYEIEDVGKCGVPKEWKMQKWESGKKDIRIRDLLDELNKLGIPPKEVTERLTPSLPAGSSDSSLPTAKQKASGSMPVEADFEQYLRSCGIDSTLNPDGQDFLKQIMQDDTGMSKMVDQLCKEFETAFADSSAPGVAAGKIASQADDDDEKNIKVSTEKARINSTSSGGSGVAGGAAAAGSATGSTTGSTPEGNNNKDPNNNKQQMDLFEHMLKQAMSEMPEGMGGENLDADSKKEIEEMQKMFTGLLGSNLDEIMKNSGGDGGSAENSGESTSTGGGKKAKGDSKKSSSAGKPGQNGIPGNEEAPECKVQ